MLINILDISCLDFSKFDYFLVKFDIGKRLENLLQCCLTD
jgi:hypothetical protein